MTIFGVHFCDHFGGSIFVTIFGVHFCDHFWGSVGMANFGVHWGSISLCLIHNIDPCLFTNEWYHHSPRFS